MLLNLVLAIIFSLRHGEAANENEVEFGQMCVLYDLLSKTIPESKITTREATGTAEAPKKALTNFLSLAQKLNLSVAEPQIVEVLSHLQIYKDKKSVTDDETKKYFFTLADDAELKKLQQLYKEITGTGDADKAFSTKYGAPLSEAQRATIRKPMKQLYDRMLELKRQLDDTAATQETAEKNARKQMTLALYGSDQLSAVGDKLDPRQKLADPAEGQFPWANGARDANCAVASTTKGHAGLALATDMLCICLKHESSTHNQCAGNFIPSAADYAAARSQHDALDAWVKLSKQCPTATDATSLTELQYRLASATSAVLSSLGSNHQTVAAAQSSSNTDRKKMNFLGYYTLGGGRAQLQRNRWERHLHSRQRLLHRLQLIPQKRQTNTMGCSCTGGTNTHPQSSGRICASLNSTASSTNHNKPNGGPFADGEFTTNCKNTNSRNSERRPKNRGAESMQKPTKQNSRGMCGYWM
uniref:Variant surface glycoprotein 1125.4320 n=1 Tax=Trypanosoma brucei TaxID=5691 RepID=A0A1J0RAH9_9TRYP|nr:variant surface glycoprotein 1125.4320 [Trypanosoma brucei]